MKYSIIEGNNISKLSLGNYFLSGVYGRFNKEKFKEIVFNAYENGINYFDTSLLYGEEAEKNLGDAVKNFRNSIFIATKTDYDRSKIINKNFIKSSCEKSLKNLKTDFIDFYYLHFDDEKCSVDEIIDAITELKKDGKIRFFGLSHVSQKRLDEFLKTDQITSVMIEFNPVNYMNFQNFNTNYISYSITARGLLTGKITKNTKFDYADIRNKDPMFYGPRFKSALEIQKEFERLGKEYNKTSVQVAINWILSKEELKNSLMGVKNISQLNENLESVRFDLRKNDLKYIDNYLDNKQEEIFINEMNFIREIFNKEIKDKNKGIRVLIYVIENFVSKKILEEKKALEFLKKIYFETENLELKKLNDLKEKLKIYLDLA